MSVLIFANPYSGRGRNDRNVARLETELAHRDLQPRVVWEKDQRIAALQDAADPPVCVVAAGGDGSIAAVINDMHRADRLHLPFATLPVGTENLFARELGFFASPARIAAAIAAGQTRGVDLGLAQPAEGTELLFTLLASTGFDAEVVHRLADWRSADPDGSLRRVSRSTYLPRVLGAMVNYRFPRVALEVDGRVIEGGQAYVFNLPQYGANLGIGSHAKTDDGLLDWVVFKKPGFVNLLGYHALVCCGGRHLSCRSVEYGTATHVRLRALTDHMLPAQIDGDPAGHTPVDVSVQPQALQVIRM